MEAVEGAKLRGFEAGYQGGYDLIKVCNYDWIRVSGMVIIMPYCAFVRAVYSIKHNVL